MEPTLPSTRDGLVREAQRSIFFDFKPQVRPRERYWLHLLLFILTLVTTAWAGGLLVGRFLYYEQAGTAWPWIFDGLRYGISLMLFLSFHEFGHYFAARRHGISVTLPYYIPFLPYINIIGTFGAVIRIREPIPSMRKLFDVGVAGPIAGFVVALGVVVYALFTLPPPTYLLDMPGHEALKAYILEFGRFPDQPLPEVFEGAGMTLVVGQTPLFWFLTQLFPNVPPMYELHHYPMLFAGWLGLFFTALNLLPVGQLDGGHILYALAGPRWHGWLARGFVVFLLISGAIGFATDVAPVFLEFSAYGEALSWFTLSAVLFFFLNKMFGRDLRWVAPVLLGIISIVLTAQSIGPAATQFGYYGWFLWCLLIIILIRVDHPPVLYHEPLTPRRKMLAIASIVIFFLCFSIKPLYIL